MGTKTITTAEMNFFQARQRVRKKLGTNTTGNAHCPTTTAEFRGGPRPGREMGKAPNTKTFTSLRDDMDHPRSDHERERASWREPPPHPHGAPLCEHPGVDPSTGGRTGTCACGAAFKQSRAAVSYYEKMGYGPRFRCFVCSAAQRLRRKQAPLRPARTPSPTPVQPPAAAAADLQLAAGQAVVDLPSALSTLCAQVCAAHDELKALTTRLAQLHAALVAPTTTTKTEKMARADPSPDPATPPPTPADPIADPSPGLKTARAGPSPDPAARADPVPDPAAAAAEAALEAAGSLAPGAAVELHSLTVWPELNGRVGTVTDFVSNQGRGLPTSPIADPSPGLTSPGLPTPPFADPSPPSPIADPSPALTTPPSPIADPALLNPTSDAHIASGVDQLERIHTLLCTLRAETALALLEPNRVSDLFDDVAEDLVRCLLMTRASPDLCSSIGIDQPAWTEDDYTEQGGALLMALGINAPATVLAAIKCQCHMGAPFGYPPPETAPQQMRELHEALAALKPHATWSSSNFNFPTPTYHSTIQPSNFNLLTYHPALQLQPTKTTTLFCLLL